MQKFLWRLGPALVLLSSCSGQGDRLPSASVPLSPSATVDGSAPGLRLGAAASCTLTQGFWKTHPEAWPVTEIALGGVTYNAADALAILSTPPRGDATYILAYQLIAAKLNVLNGADPSAVATTLADADAFLTAHPLGSKPGGLDRDAAVALAEVLDSYNNGLIGPGHCGEVLPTPEPTPEPTPTPGPA